VKSKRSKGAPGRRLASESRSSEIRAKLLEWRRTPLDQRVSIRTLGVQLGVSHQLLSFYLKGLDKWQREEERKGYKLKAQEIYDRAKAEHRYMTEWEQAQYVACQRASLRLLLDSVLDAATSRWLREFRKHLDDGDLAQAREAAKLLARTGNREDQEFLARSRGQKNLPDLPTAPNRGCKSFRRGDQ